MKKILLLTILQLSLLMAGSFVMTKGNSLIKSGESRNSTPLTSKTAISKHLSSGETWKFENQHMDNISDIGIEIIGSVGTNQTVIIKDSKFTNIKLPIRILYVDNVIIEGNYFQDMWAGIHIMVAKNVSVRYNKFERHGVKPGRSNTSWAGNFLHLGLCTLDTLSIEHNLKFVPF